MSRVQDLHREAMQAAERGDLARRSGDEKRAEVLFREALDKEKEAAMLFKDELKTEPTRSVLFRSAASLALDCGELRLAEQLIGQGLAGEAPEEIAEELRNLLERVHFERHLEVRGVELAHEEVQLTIAGNAVSYGLAASKHVLNRVSRLQTMIHRTVERLKKEPFKQRPSSSVRNLFGLYMSVPRAASYAVTLHVGKPTGERSLFGESDKAHVLGEVVNGLRLVNEGSEKELRDRIYRSARYNQRAYFQNFFALARLIAPDGKDIKQVGLTFSERNQVEKLSLTRPRSAIPERAITEQPKGEYVEIEGELKAAEEIKENMIKLVDDRGRVHTVIVPEGMMADIVKPLWGERVAVAGYRSGRRQIHMHDIDPAEE